MSSYLLAPSLLAADFARLGDEADAVLAAGADVIHLDVMDNHYVPNLTVGPMVCAALRKHGITAPIDVHLMVEPVDSMIQAFAKAGATYISFHPEASLHVDRSLRLIRDLGCKAGLAINPATPLTILDHTWDLLDMILMMSVNPGFGGQSFISTTLEKLKTTRALIEQHQTNIVLAVDGGITLDTIKPTKDAGATMFIAGSAIFHTANYAQTIADLRAKLN